MRDHVLLDLDQVERILSRVRAPGLDREVVVPDCTMMMPLAAILARIYVQRIADISAVQVPAKDQVDLQLVKAIQRLPAPPHHVVLVVVVGRWGKMVVGHDDTRAARAGRPRTPGAEIELPAGDAVRS